MTRLCEIFFYLASISYLFSYSEKPFGIFVLAILLINGKVNSILCSFLIVIADAFIQYVLYDSILPRFLQNLYTLSILIALIENKPLTLKKVKINNLFYIFVCIGIFRFIDNINGNPIIFVLNENLIGIAIFSIMLQSGFSLIGFILLMGLSVKGLAIQSIFLRLSLIQIIIAIVIVFLFYIIGFGVINEYILDLYNGTFSSGRIELWKILLDDFKYFNPYDSLIKLGLSNTESFFFNQIYSYPFIWPLIWIYIVLAIFQSYGKNLDRLVVFLVCALYPYPHFILFLRLFRFN